MKDTYNTACHALSEAACKTGVSVRLRGAIFLPGLLIAKNLAGLLPVRPPCCPLIQTESLIFFRLRKFAATVTLTRKRLLV